MKLREWIRENYYELNPWHYLDEEYNKIDIFAGELGGYEVIEHYKGEYVDIIVVRRVDK